MKNRLNSLGIGYDRELAEADLRQIVKCFRLYPESFDTCWFGTLPAVKQLIEHQEFAEKLAAVAAVLRAEGLEVSLRLGVGWVGSQVLADDNSGFDSQLMIGGDGAAVGAVPCPASPAFLRHISAVSRIYGAYVRPETLWIDDNHIASLSVDHGGGRSITECFCPRCLENFTIASTRKLSREELIAEFKMPQSYLWRLWAKFNALKMSNFAGAIAEALFEVSAESAAGIWQGCGSFQYERADFELISDEMMRKSGRKISICCGIDTSHGDSTRYNIVANAQFAGRTATAAFSSGAVAEVIANVGAKTDNQAQKSLQTTLLEGALALLCGCTGISWMLGFHCENSPEKYSEYWAEIELARPFYEKLQMLSRNRAAGKLSLDSGKKVLAVSNACSAETLMVVPLVGADQKVNAIFILNSGNNCLGDFDIEIAHNAAAEGQWYEYRLCGAAVKPIALNNNRVRIDVLYFQECILLAAEG